MVVEGSFADLGTSQGSRSGTKERTSRSGMELTSNCRGLKYMYIYMYIHIYAYTSSNLPNLLLQYYETPQVYLNLMLVIIRALPYSVGLPERKKRCRSTEVRVLMSGFC